MTSCSCAAQSSPPGCRFQAQAAQVQEVGHDGLRAGPLAGAAAADEFLAAIRAGLEALAGAANATFPRPLPGNVIPQCETFRADGYTTEEVKLQDETHKILGLPGLPVTMTCVRVPVAVGHAAAILVEMERDLSPAAAEEALRVQPGVIVHSGTGYPTPLEIAGRDEVFIGRIRRDPTHPRRLWLWQASDNLRKGAATNAVQIAEELLRRGFVAAVR